MKAIQRWIAGALVVAAFWPAASARAGCEGCDALCPLLDYYDQRKRGLEIWTKWASSNPKKSPPPAGATETHSTELAFQKEFDAALADRELPCELSPVAKLKNLLGMQEGSVADLGTSIDQSCAITWNGDRLDQGDTQQRYEASVDCKPLSDGTIEHEKAHQQFCKDAWARDPATAATYLDTPENVAESERLAWTRHRDELERKIRDVIEKNGCGWEPTTRQLATPGSIPSVHQVKEMQDRMWVTNAELNEAMHPSHGHLP